MAVGKGKITCYQGEDVSWLFTVNDPNISDITSQVIQLVVKATAAEVDPALLGPVTCSVESSLTFLAEHNVDLAPGKYVYSARRVDLGFSWQYAQGELEVLDSASID